MRPPHGGLETAHLRDRPGGVAAVDVPAPALRVEAFAITETVVSVVVPIEAAIGDFLPTQVVDLGEGLDDILQRVRVEIDRLDRGASG